jgi:hypothetical protein
MISNRALTELVTSFGATYLLSPVAISEELIRIQVQETLYKQTALSQSALLHDLRFIQQTIRSNEYASSLATNFYLRYPLRAVFYSWMRPKMTP